MILFARSLSGKNPDFCPGKSPIDVSGILRRVRLAVPKDSRLRHTASRGLPLEVTPLSHHCGVLPGAGSDHRAI